MFCILWYYHCVLTTMRSSYFLFVDSRTITYVLHHPWTILPHQILAQPSSSILPPPSSILSPICLPPFSCIPPPPSLPTPPPPPTSADGEGGDGAPLEPSKTPEGPAYNKKHLRIMRRAPVSKAGAVCAPRCAVIRALFWPFLGLPWGCFERFEGPQECSRGRENPINDLRPGGS